MNVISKTLKSTGSFLRFLMLTSMVVGYAAQAQNSQEFSEQSESPVDLRTNLNLNQGEVLLNRGHWTSQVIDGYNCIEFRGDGSESWNISKCFELGSFELQAQGVAMLTREAGTLILNGELGPESGEGRYSYTADRRFNRYLSREFDMEEVEFTLPLFLGDMQTDFMDFLSDHYGALEPAQVTELAIHNISQTDFETSLSLYREFDTKDPSLEDIVATKSNGIDREYIEELQQAGYDDLTLDQMKQAKAHGITREIIAGLRDAGSQAIPLDLLLRTQFHGLTVETAELLQSLSEENLSLEAMIELHRSGIDQTYIEQLQAVGFTGLSLPQMVKAKAMEIDAGFVKALNDAELETDYASVLLAKAAALDTAYVSGYAASKMDGVSLDELVTAKQVGLSFDGIEVWNELGPGEVSFSELLQAQMLGVDTTDLDAFRKQGVVVYSLRELISARVHGVDIAYVQQIQGVPVSEVSDSIATNVEQQPGELNETPQGAEVDTQDMTQAIARAQQALLSTGNDPIQEDNETAAEIPGEFPRELHQYITLKLNQDALSAQEALELRRQSEEVNQETQGSGQETEGSGLEHLGL